MDKERAIRAHEASIARLKGEKLPTGGASDIAWLDKEIGTRFLKSCPRSFYAELVGKQLKSLNDQSATYGIPTKAGEDVNIIEVLKWFDGFLNEWGRRIKQKLLDDENKSQRAEKKEQLELQQLELKLRGLAADLEKKAGAAIPIEEVERNFAWFEGELRRLGERLGKRFGSDAQKLFNSTLDRMAKSLYEARD